jgi:TPR repeat protein
MYAEGRAVETDPVEALAWYSLADLRYPGEDAKEAKANREDIQELTLGLDAEELARAKQRTATLDAQSKRTRKLPAKALQPGEKST